ncbi:hypothetical protein IFM89_038035 [Coptis chinensis]|uniref:pectinesterase n=1 Tax=Coptis chinensis TaxID=261450 RepID=A0A835HTA0_9MAGN|nr:hypothetical protein IFM89_038035 [Coptis chinensis]
MREILMGKYGEDSKLIYDLADQTHSFATTAPISIPTLQPFASCATKTDKSSSSYFKIKLAISGHNIGGIDKFLGVKSQKVVSRIRNARLVQQLQDQEQSQLRIGVRLWRGHKVFFCKCTINKTETIYLGTAWGIFSRVVCSFCDLDGIINPSGWMDWGDPSRIGTVWLGEYKCKGRGADLRRQVPWAISFRDEKARPFLDRNFNRNFINRDRWLQL